MEYFSTGEVSKKLNVSLRTLRYYDQIDLVPPTRKEDNGKRYYTKEDIVELEKVLLLRTASISLSDIQNILQHMTIKKTLAIHHKQLQSEIEHLQQSLQFTNELWNTLELEGEVQWNHLLPLFSKEHQAMQEEQKKEWMDQLFTEEEQDSLNDQLPKMNSDSPDTTKWINLIKRIEICLDEQKSPQSKSGQLIAQDTLLLSEETFNGDEQLAHKFFEARKSQTISSSLNLYPVHPDVLSFLEAAITYYETNSQ
ncbi:MULTISPECIES: MerR family transcriptional regulator [Pontibacillus]|uniref:MerR family transcriptional regulator n=1 Tax=Pontibacillus chungwhensis TaxID=265426 RepID=A0ABY8V4R7_9BACI|nr:MULTISPECIES: MerR family transcriptional regulator [Pontibacillus]MCD5324870.1 MerR family transcriptional regulator [Pontibacillus sp. HN14]WIF98831.1 MerR family transcriptional regulator [Pontibacillus chungwhensis]